MTGQPRSGPRKECHKVNRKSLNYSCYLNLIRKMLRGLVIRGLLSRLLTTLLNSGPPTRPGARKALNRVVW